MIPLVRIYYHGFVALGTPCKSASQDSRAGNATRRVWAINFNSPNWETYTDWGGLRGKVHNPSVKMEMQNMLPRQPSTAETDTRLLAALGPLLQFECLSAPSN